MGSLASERPRAGASSRPAFAVGIAYEAGLDESQRKRGAHFTPCDVAVALAERALRAWRQPGAPVVCDPACGGGVFLVAMADALATVGVDPRRIVEELIVGIDIDPGAARATREALRAWGREHKLSLVPRVRHGDALAAWPELDGRVDIVVGNPPFQSQMARVNVRSADDRAAAIERFGAAGGGYADTASLFVLRSLEMVRPGGLVALVLPRSLLATRDGAGMRRAVADRARLVECWIPTERVFAASVDVCMPLIESDVTVGSRDLPTILVGGRLADTTLGEVVVAGESWSALHATACGVPDVAAVNLDEGTSAQGPQVIGEVATATAGFRDQYYGLVGHVTDELPSGHGARLATTAMIDPGRCRWGDVGVRFAKRRFESPWVDLDGVRLENPGVCDWVERLLVPKVLVATQTRVIESVADRHGSFVPSTPIIAVVPTGVHGAGAIAAALLAPPASAWAHHRFGGAALSGTALKLAARQVTQIPLPREPEPWVAATALLDAGDSEGSGDFDWHEIGLLLCESWQVHDDRLLRWWLELVV